MPGDAALVELLVAGAVDVLFPVALEPKLPFEDEPLLRSLCDPPVAEPVVEPPAPDDAAREPVAGAPDDVVLDDVEPVVVGLAAAALLVELVAIPSIVAPRPALPADALPPEEPPPLPLLGGETAVTVGVLVKVAPEVTVADAPVPVLVNVWPDVTCEDWAELLGVELDCDSVGSVTAPVATCP